ncbi:MAG: hypothetical protein CMP38_03695 [Rickettsiales bacterium]|nr:hypothetical protein [Rickettsiales bacterium]|tara:strand:+ start:1700 stop:1978 length:279 start_codon:yes stop_codon:yes gene_type:complete
MVKKLKGEQFYLSANDLTSGDVIYLSKDKWSTDFNKAIKIRKDDIEKYEKIAIQDENKCLIIGPFFVELTEEGQIRKLRDKIRKNGLTFKIT